MSKVIFLKRYFYIIEKLKSFPCNFHDLQKYVIQKLEKDDLRNYSEYSIRTFSRDKIDILDIFGIHIEYNRKDNTYYIEEETNETYISRIIDAFSIHQVLKIGDKVSSSVYLENRKSSGTHLLKDLIYAIQNRHQISFTHTKFWEMEITKRNAKPIAIKESQHRWYLIAEDSKDHCIKNFGFDRISDMKILDTKFTPINYDVQQAYQHAFGIETYNPAQRVVLRFSWQQGNYIKSFPLHFSQKVVEDTELGLILELFIHPTNDIVMELLKYGSEVKVLEPQFLKDIVKERILEMNKIYE